MPSADVDGRFQWIVSWGRPGRHDWATVRVWAYDADEALATAREEHPDRPAPRIALPVT